MRRLQTTYSDGTGRIMTPALLPNDVYLRNRYPQPEGVYDAECWPHERRIKITFSLFHQGLFKEPILLHELSYDTYDQIMTVWSNLRGPWAFTTGFNPAERFCTPVIQRDSKIAMMTLQPGVKFFRQRNSKKFAIQLLFNKSACSDWFVTHYHGVMVKITHADTGIVAQEEKYDCDHVMEGIARYKYVLENFDLAYMELQL